MQKIKNKTLYFTTLLLPVRSQKLSKIAPKRSKIDFRKHLMILASSFTAPDPQKGENTSRVKDFGGGSAAGALAACYHLTPRASPDWFQLEISAFVFGPLASDRRRMVWWVAAMYQSVPAAVRVCWQDLNLAALWRILLPACLCPLENIW